MDVYHCTTDKKLTRYKSTGCILPPVRYWTTKYSAYKWMKKVGRTVLLSFPKPQLSYPLPMRGGAEWTPFIVRNYNKEE